MLSNVVINPCSGLVTCDRLQAHHRMFPSAFFPDNFSVLEHSHRADGLHGPAAGAFCCPVQGNLCSRQSPGSRGFSVVIA